MTSWRIALAAALSSAALAAGCSGDRIPDSPRVAQCKRVCEASKKCPNTDAEAQAVDCFTLCDDIDAVNAAANCYSTFDDLYGCIDRKGVCGEADVGCKSQAAAYDDCIAEHCSSDPDRDDCGL